MAAASVAASVAPAARVDTLTFARLARLLTTDPSRQRDAFSEVVTRSHVTAMGGLVVFLMVTPTRGNEFGILILVEGRTTRRGGFWGQLKC